MTITGYHQNVNALTFVLQWRTFMFPSDGVMAYWLPEVTTILHKRTDVNSK